MTLKNISICLFTLVAGCASVDRGSDEIQPPIDPPVVTEVPDAGMPDAPTPDAPQETSPDAGTCQPECECDRDCDDHKTCRHGKCEQRCFCDSGCGDGESCRWGACEHEDHDHDD